MHYTSIENIHKVIDPLFLNDLNEEFDEIVEGSLPTKKKIELLNTLQNKLASMKFLDIKTPRLIQFNDSSADFAA